MLYDKVPNSLFDSGYEFGDVIAPVAVKAFKNSVFIKAECAADIPFSYVVVLECSNTYY